MIGVDFFAASEAWRWHGLGMLQRELSEGTRIHIFHPRLLRVPDAHFRRVHDHRFDIDSLVLVGELVDVAYDVFFAADNEPNTKCWGIRHAKMQTGDDVSDLGPVRAVEIARERRPVGTSYHIPRRRFHTTVVDDLAITVVSRTNFDRNDARVLGDVAHSAIAGNHSPIKRDDDVVAGVLDRARSAFARGAK